MKSYDEFIKEYLEYPVGTFKTYVRMVKAYIVHELSSNPMVKYSKKDIVRLVDTIFEINPELISSLKKYYDDKKRFQFAAEQILEWFFRYSDFDEILSYASTRDENTNAETA